MKQLFFIIAYSLALTATAQQGELPALLKDIEQNNLTLKALREDANAQKLGNKTGIFLANPEIGVSHVWGNPSEPGSHQNISVSQELDVATIGGFKQRTSRKRNEAIELQYAVERTNLLLEAKKAYIELVYQNNQIRELEVRKQHAQRTVKLFEKRLKAGDASLLEYNKARLSLTGIEGTLERAIIEQENIQNTLLNLNGGIPITPRAQAYEPTLLPNDFAQWYTMAESKSPEIAQARQITIAEQSYSKQVRMEGLPSITAGYEQENIGNGEGEKSVSIGLSIPLWANKNKVKQAKAAVQTAKTREEAIRQTQRNRLEGLYRKALSLQKTVAAYRNALQTQNNTPRLNSALESGNISLLDYLTEIALYYDTVDQTLSTERDLQNTIAELTAYDL